jgi:lysyl endopeptidase
MKKLILIISLVIITILSYSQINIGGLPHSFDNKLVEEISSGIEFKTVDAKNVPAYKNEDAMFDAYKDRPWRFGENISVNFSITNSGITDILSNGDKIWRLGIYSPGALSINLTFDKYKLPRGAKLFIYNSEKTEVLGAFTELNNQTDGWFATTLLRSDAVIIEYYEPSTSDFQGELNLCRVTHGYRNAFDYAEKAFGSSGSCNVNVACTQSAGWENEIRSVCMLVSGSNGFCTGSLINNTNNDGTPYMLTADHCYSDPSSWIFWFNWQSSTCSNPGTSPAYNSISGATLKSRNSSSDFCLVQMNQTPPSNYNVFYSGWNRTLDQDIMGTIFGIHHPSGDIKKISWANSGITTTTYLQNTIPGDASHWRVTSWSDGTTTEGGSSGSPLYDPNHRIVGQLHGGYAACNNTSSDWYGKFGVSWTGGGTNESRLSNWLDPYSTSPLTCEGYDPNTPVLTLDAKPLAVSVPSSNYCGEQNINPTVTIKNNGTLTITNLIIKYTINNIDTVVFSWTGNLNSTETTDVIFPEIALLSGSFTFRVFTTLPNGQQDLNSANDTISKSVVVLPNDMSMPYTELFDAEIFPPCGWISFIGANGIGTSQNWNRATTNTYLSSPGSAYVRYENVSGGMAEDWLVSPLITLPESALLSFYQRQSYSNNYNTSYQIKISTASQNTISDFINVESYTESAFGTTYTKKTIDLSNYDNQDVFIAFVMSQDDGDDWYIDSIKISGIISQKPNANYTSDIDHLCGGNSVTFQDLSSNTPTNWLWSFSGGIPSESSLQHPTVYYETPGTYSVSLIASNVFGEDELIQNSFITVYGLPEASAVITDETELNACNGSIILNPFNGNAPYSYIWDISAQKSFNGQAGEIIKNTTNYYPLSVENIPSLDGYLANIESICLNITYGNLIRITEISILSPDNTEIILLSGLSGANLTNTCFSNTGSSGSISSGIAPYTGNFLPIGDLNSLYNNQNPNGIWQLKIVSGNQNSASVINWSIVFNHFITDSFATELCSGQYVATITDSNNCNAVITEQINVSPALLSVHYSSENVICHSVCDGYIKLISTGGQPPYSYVWNNGNTEYEYDNLCAGMYEITVYDSETNFVTLSITLSEPDAFSFSENHTDIICFGDNNGTISTSMTGGTPPYYYIWSNGSNENNIDSLVQGVHYVTITDSNACIFTTNITLIQPDQIENNAEIIHASCNENNGEIVANTNGGIMPYSYQWSNGSTIPSISSASAGNYSLTVTDNNNCTQIDFYAIEQKGLPEIHFIAQSPTCFNSSDGLIIAEISGGMAPYVFQWDNGINTNQQSDISEGNYSLTISDVHNCLANSNVFISAPDSMVVAEIITSPSCYLATDASIELIVSGGISPYTFLWSDGSFDDYRDDLSAGLYHVTVTDSNNCSFTKNDLQIIEPAEIIISFEAENLRCFEDNSGAIYTFVSGGNAPFSYAWSNLEITENLQNLIAGIYTLSITDSNNCFAINQILVSQPGLLTYDTIIVHASSFNTNDGSIEAMPISGTPPYSISWSNGSNSFINDNLLPGLYLFTITDSNLCQCFGSVQVDYSNSNSIMSDMDGIIISPNPANDFILVYSSNPEQQINEIILYGSDGKKLISQKPQGSFMKLNIDNYSRGIYFIQVRLNNKNVYNIIIKE